MTIGPAPMIRMLLISVRFGIAHHFREAVEQVANIVGSWTRLWMALKAERRPVGPGEPLEGTVEERNMRRPQGRRYGRRINSKTVVLTGDDHLAGVQILHGMVGAVVAKLHLHGLGA